MLSKMRLFANRPATTIRSIKTKTDICSTITNTLPQQRSYPYSQVQEYYKSLQLRESHISQEKNHQAVKAYKDYLRNKHKNQPIEISLDQKNLIKEGQQIIYEGNRITLKAAMSATWFLQNALKGMMSTLEVEIARQSRCCNLTALSADEQTTSDDTQTKLKTEVDNALHKFDKARLSLDKALGEFLSSTRGAEHALKTYGKHNANNEPTVLAEEQPSSPRLRR
ncbi:MAG: hypothetical protein ACK4PR_04920 [Gammaproteobacteria bacterium]